MDRSEEEDWGYDSGRYSHFIKYHNLPLTWSHMHESPMKYQLIIQGVTAKSEYDHKAPNFGSLATVKNLGVLPNLCIEYLISGWLNLCLT